MSRFVLSSALALSLGQLALALPAELERPLPKILPRGTKDFSLPATLALPSTKLDKRDGAFDTFGISTAWTVGGQRQVGFIDLGGGFFTTRNISAVNSNNEQNGWYDISNSSTVTIIPGATWQQCFNDQCDHGPVVKDDMTIFDISVPQVLVMACDSSCQGDTANWGMTRGLTTSGWDINGQSTTGPSWFGSLSSQLTQTLWTLWMGNGEGVFNFGYIDSSRYTGDIGYIYNDNDNAFWNGQITGYSFSNGGPSSTTDVFHFFLDTGNGNTGLDPDLFAAYHAAIPGAEYDSSGNYHYPCEESLPDWTMNIGGVDVTIPGISFKGGVVSGDTCWTTFVSGASFASGQSNAWGLDFIRGTFMVFDYSSDDQSDRIGFANSAPPS